MKVELFVTLLAVICSAVFQINLLQVVAVFDITYRLLCLVIVGYKAMKKRQRKCPSSSDQRDGRLRYKRGQ